MTLTAFKGFLEESIDVEWIGTSAYSDGVGQIGTLTIKESISPKKLSQEIAFSTFYKKEFVPDNIKIIQTVLNVNSDAKLSKLNSNLVKSKKCLIGEYADENGKNNRVFVVPGSTKLCDCLVCIHKKY